MTTRGNALHDRSLGEVAEAIRAGMLSATEVMQHTLARIAARAEAGADRPFNPAFCLREVRSRRLGQGPRDPSKATRPPVRGWCGC